MYTRGTPKRRTDRCDVECHLLLLLDGCGDESDPGQALKKPDPRNFGHFNLSGHKQFPRFMASVLDVSRKSEMVDFSSVEIRGDYPGSLGYGPVNAAQTEMSYTHECGHDTHPDCLSVTTNSSCPDDQQALQLLRDHYMLTELGKRCESL